MWEKEMISVLYSRNSPHYNATCVPATGYDALDQKKFKISDIPLTVSEIKSLRKRESLQGILDDR